MLCSIPLWVDVTDKVIWGKAVAAVMSEYAALSAERRRMVKDCAVVIQSLKRELHAFVEDANGGEICASCGGECCRGGKCHFTVVDLLVYLATEKPLFEPCFEHDICPYFGDHGCMMEPGYRPFNCIIFNCEQIEGFWGAGQAGNFYRLENELRSVYGKLEQIFANRFMHGLIVNYERDVVINGATILRSKRKAANGNNS